MPRLAILVACLAGGVAAGAAPVRRAVPASSAATTAVTVYEPPPAPTTTVWDGVYTEAQATEGQVLYRARCAYCHGVFLDGAEDPNGPPLTGIRFMAGWRDHTVGQLLATIAQTMPANEPGSLTEAEARTLAAYILQQNGMPAGDAPLPADPDRLAQIAFTPRP